jgi:hypothetical protein
MQRQSDLLRADGSWITGYAEAILTSELGDWIVSQLPTTRSELSLNTTPSGAGLPRLEHQVGRFLSIFEERLTRKA